MAKEPDKDDPKQEEEKGAPRAQEAGPSARRSIPPQGLVRPQAQAVDVTSGRLSPDTLGLRPPSSSGPARPCENQQ